MHLGVFVKARGRLECVLLFVAEIITNVFKKGSSCIAHFLRACLAKCAVMQCLAYIHPYAVDYLFRFVERQRTLKATRSFAVT